MEDQHKQEHEEKAHVQDQPKYEPVSPPSAGPSKDKGGAQELKAPVGSFDDPTSWGNQSPSRYQILGARQVFWRVFFLLCLEPVYAFLEDTLYISKILHTSLNHPFKPKIIHTIRYEPCQDIPCHFNMQFCAAKEIDNLLYYIIPAPNKNYRWGGIFAITSLSAPSKFFSIKGQYGQSASIITADGKEDSTNDYFNEGSNVWKDLHAKAKLVADRTYENINVFGFTFKGAVSLDSQNAATLDKNTHISVTAKLPNEITHLNHLFMFSCRHSVIELLLVKLEDEAIEHLSKFYTVKGAIQFLEKYQISYDSIQSIVAHCLVSVEDIMSLSPFESAVCVIPILNKRDAYAFVLTPAIIAELKVRYHMSNMNISVQ